MPRADSETRRGSPRVDRCAAFDRATQSATTIRLMNLFVITGVCQSGSDINLLLPRFLARAKCQILLWIDFKDVADYSRNAHAVRVKCPQANLRCAPRAMWGAASIVLSMLEAIHICVQNFTSWDRIIFCSIHDVPLASCDDLLRNLASEWNFDYCGSRWNTSSWDVLRSIELTPVADILHTARSYRTYRPRPDISLKIENELANIYTVDAVNSLRLCNDLYERFLVAAWEFPPQGTLVVRRMSRSRAIERLDFFSNYGLIAGRQWCVLGRRFCELLLSFESGDLFYMFDDVVIPDECFFQTVADHYALRGTITVRWDNIYHADAQNLRIDEAMLTKLIRGAGRQKLLARKGDISVNNETLERLL
jgi:hypothetical protein